MSDFIIAQIRTYVPLTVGAAVAWLAARGLHLEATAITGFVTVLTALVTALYYLVVHTAERYVSPKFGWLLGWAKLPVYVSPNKQMPVPETVAPQV